MELMGNAVMLMGISAYNRRAHLSFKGERRNSAARVHVSGRGDQACSALWKYRNLTNKTC